jgi:serine/threonine protein kinase
VRTLSDAALDRLRRAADWPHIEGTRYEILELLDRGGMGAVYLAHDRELDREVAIKVLHEPEPAPDAVDRLRDEARIIAGLEHPGIVPVHDAGRLPDGRAFYAMKRATGTRLDRCAAQASLVDRLRWFERICEPVAFAHAQGIIHRDLKPENIIIGALGEVLVMDCGLAMTRETQMGDARTAAREAWVAGTPGYMSPEQAQGDPTIVDERSDIYSLGAVLHFLLVGTPPSPGPDGRIPSLRFRGGTIPRPLESICLTALSPRPTDRYSSVVDLRADAGRFLVGDRVLTHRETPWEMMGRQAGRYRVALALVGAYLAMRVILHLFFRR